MRILGIDLGERRIGVAVSDPTGTIASPLTTLSRRAGKRLPVAALRELALKYEARQLVVGLPLDLSGQESAWCREVREVGDAVADTLDLPVAYQDERLTSARAERTVRALGLPRSKRREKERVDAIAAALILQAYLDRETST